MLRPIKHSGYGFGMILALSTAILFLLPKSTHAATTIVLTSSDPAANKVLYFALQNYPHPAGPHSAPNPAVNWPLRSEGCVATGVTDYKSMPWAAVNGSSFSGNYFAESGNCASRYYDSGTGTTPPWGGAPGAWLNPSAFGGWALSGSLGWSTPAAQITAGNSLANLTLISYGPDIWGTGTRDDNEQSTAMYQRNGWSSYSPLLCLYDNGSTLFRNEFTLSAANAALVANGTYDPVIDIAADDFYQAYIDGIPAAYSVWTIGRQQINLSGNPAIKARLSIPGPHVIAIQAVDKAVWTTCGVTGFRAAGLFYNLDIISNGSVVATPGSYTVTASGQSYEKGSGGNVAIPYKLTVNTCPAGATDTVKWQGTGTAVITTTVDPAACSAGATVGSSQTTVSGATLDSQPPGNYGSYSASISSINGSPPSPAITSGPVYINVYEVPYTRIYGNDSFVYGNGPLVLNPKDPSTNTADAGGSQYAIITKQLLASAINASTAVFRAAAPSHPDGLAAQWQGGGNMPNIADVVNNLPHSATAASVPLGGTSIPASGSAYYDYGRNIDATLGPLTTNSAKVTVRAKNIYIRGDITANYASGAPFNDANVPVILLVADNGGSIYIDSSVRRIDAILVAPGGTVYTCANGMGSEMPRAQWSGAAPNCRTKLVINGAVGAQNIRFSRSIGTRLLATGGEDAAATDTGKQIGGSNGDNNHAAEVINYPSYLYFATPNLIDTSTSGYQSLFNAPPQL